MGVDVFLFHIFRHQSSSGGPGDVGDVFLLFLQSLALNVIPKTLRNLCKGKGGTGGGLDEHTFCFHQIPHIIIEH